MKICPSCRMLWDEGANFCGRDGTRLEPWNGEEAVVLCLVCGHRLSWPKGTTCKQCPQCGVDWSLMSPKSDQFTARNTQNEP